MRREEKRIKHKKVEEQEGSSIEDQVELLEGYEARKRVRTNDWKAASPDSSLLEGREPQHPEERPKEKPPPTSFSEMEWREKEPS